MKEVPLTIFILGYLRLLSASLVFWTGSLSVSFEGLEGAAR